jgi:hypothetical protein
MFAESRLAGPDRLSMMRAVAPIFRGRWLPWMQREAAALRVALPAMLDRLKACEPVLAGWMARALIETLQGAAAIVPDIDLTAEQLEITALAGAYPDEAATA